MAVELRADHRADDADEPGRDADARQLDAAWRRRSGSDPDVLAVIFTLYLGKEIVAADRAGPGVQAAAAGADAAAGPAPAAAGERWRRWC